MSVEIGQLQAKKERLEKEVGALESDKTTVSKEINAKRSEIVKQAELQEWLKEKIAPLQEEVSALETQKSAYVAFSSLLDDSPVRAQKRQFKSKDGSVTERVVLPVAEFERLEQKARYYNLAVLDKKMLLSKNKALKSDNERLQTDNYDLREKVAFMEKALKTAEKRLKMAREKMDELLPDGKGKELFEKAFDYADEMLRRQQLWQQQSRGPSR